MREIKKSGWRCEILSWFKETQQSERKYLIDVLKTIKYDYMVKIVDNAHKGRNVERNIEDSQVIEIKSSLLNEIMNTNFN